MPKKLTLEEFIEKARKKHGDRYDYYLVNYKGWNIKVIIICRDSEHGEFEQTPNNHLQGKGCPECAKINRAKSKTMTLEKFIEKANKKHNNWYDYYETIYVNTKTEVWIRCPEHGLFQQTPNSHLAGHGCLKCFGRMVSDTKSFIEEATKKHNGFYNYSETAYVNTDTDVIIICLDHGKFKQRPDNHLQGQGCPDCNNSIGEKKIITYLTENNINFEPHSRFDDCRNKKLLPFDFYLTDLNICIEFDGKQHYEPVCFGGISLERATKNFDYTLKCDKIKTEYCEAKNIQLIRISYKDIKNIETILNSHLLQYQDHL